MHYIFNELWVVCAFGGAGLFYLICQIYVYSIEFCRITLNLFDVCWVYFGIFCFMLDIVNFLEAESFSFSQYVYIFKYTNYVLVHSCKILAIQSMK